MTKSELVQALASHNPNLHVSDLERVVNSLVDTLASALARGDRVEIRGFGSFSTRQRQARVGRNPRTGTSVAVAAKRTPHFKPGKELKAKLN
jgi:integration host factor subunit beta